MRPGRVVGRFTVVGLTATIAALATGAPALGLTAKLIRFPGSFEPSFAVAGPGGSAWIAETGSDAPGIASVDTSGKVAQLLPSTSSDVPSGIALGQNGNLWFVTSAIGGSGLGRVNPAGALQDFSISPLRPLDSSGAVGNAIVAGGDGQLWFSAQTAYPSVSVIAHATASGTITGNVAIPGNPTIVALALGPDGDVWFTQTGPAGVGHVSPSGQLTQILAPFGPGDHLDGLAGGPDGRVWVTDNRGGLKAVRIARIGADGSVSWLTLPASTFGGPSSLVSLAMDPHGNVWGAGPGAVVRITAAGSLSVHADPSFLPGVSDIAIGPDGTAWVPNSTYNSISEFSTLAACTVPRLIGLSRGQAIRQLTEASCALGRVRGSHRGQLEVTQQRPASGATTASDSPVDVTLGPASRIAISAPSRVTRGAIARLTESGHALGSGYALDASIDQRPCAATVISELQRGTIVDGTDWQNIGGSFRRSTSLFTRRPGRYHICAYLSLGGVGQTNLTTARASRTYTVTTT